MKQVFFSILFFSILFSSCKTDFDVTDEWKDITVIYCLLNQSDTIHYAKISKAFLGDADAYEMAQISDSLYYNNIEVSLEEYNSSGTVTNIFSLTKTTEIPKDSGIFASDNNVLYKTDAVLKTTSGYKYRLVVHNLDNDNVVYGETKLIIGASIIFPYTPLFSLGSYNNSLELKCPLLTNARIYNFKMVFHYFEIDKLTDVRTDYEIPINIGTKISDNATGNYSETISQFLSAQSFLNILGAKIPENDNVYRVVRKNPLDFEIKVGGDILYTYMEVNAPTFGLIQEKPEFTNIVNGIGLMSSLANKKYYSKGIDSQTLDSISYSSYTKKLKFVDQENQLYQNQ